jgi:hypothetical protein
MARRDDRSSEPVRITTAASSHREDIANRQRRYVISMTIRTLCFVGAVVVGSGWLRWVLVAGAVLLPYVAVVLANTGTRRDDGFELRGTQTTRELPPSATRP